MAMGEGRYRQGACDGRHGTFITHSVSIRSLHVPFGFDIFQLVQT